MISLSKSFKSCRLSESRASVSRLLLDGVATVNQTNVQQQPQQYPVSHQQQPHRFYISRAHPSVISEHPVIDSLHFIFRDIEHRTKRRERKVKMLKDAAIQKKRNFQAPRANPDETIELALNLNLDPRRPGQSLRGTVDLPHGTGKLGKTAIVFTNDEDAQKEALELGALHAGGSDLIAKLLDGSVPVDSFQTTVATTDMVGALKRAARLLGPRGLMPNKKLGTMVDDKAELLSAVETAMAGKEIQYRTEKSGIVHVLVGKASFGIDKLLENIGAIMNTLYANKPEQYGKGKKIFAKKKGQALKATQAKFLLKAYVCSTQSKSIRVDLRTIEPTSPFFLSSLDPPNMIAVDTEPEDATTAAPVAASV